MEMTVVRNVHLALYMDDYALRYNKYNKYNVLCLKIKYNQVAENELKNEKYSS